MIFLTPPPLYKRTIFSYHQCFLDHSFRFIFLICILFIHFWLCSMWDPWTRDRNCAPCRGSLESSPLDLQGSPTSLVVKWIVTNYRRKMHFTLKILCKFSKIFYVQTKFCTCWTKEYSSRFTSFHYFKLLKVTLPYQGKCLVLSCLILLPNSLTGRPHMLYTH